MTSFDEKAFREQQERLMSENLKLKQAHRGFRIMARMMFGMTRASLWRDMMAAGKYERAGAEAECQVCGLPLVEHPEIPRFETFHMVCDSRIVKL